MQTVGWLASSCGQTVMLVGRCEGVEQTGPQSANFLKICQQVSQWDGNSGGAYLDIDVR